MIAQLCKHKKIVLKIVHFKWLNFMVIILIYKVINGSAYCVVK